jgi:hypothetical protein
MLGNFDYIELSYRNYESGEVKEFKVKSYDELNKIDEQFPSDEWKRTKEGFVKCSCGRMIGCYNFTNTCSCGADYNFSGSKLAPRSQWGEETGESWWECY